MSTVVVVAAAITTMTIQLSQINYCPFAKTRPPKGYVMTTEKFPLNNLDNVINHNKRAKKKKEITTMRTNLRASNANNNEMQTKSNFTLS